MQSIVVALILFLAVASAAPSQPEQVSGQPGSSVAQAQNVPVVGNSPSVVQPSSSVVTSAEGSQSVVQPVEHHQPIGHHHVQAPPSMANYYSPAGMIHVVGEQQQKVQQQQQAARNFEQYGQPESAALPPNYKPFGSWGLYIGGNPADGYYTNYYKALGNSVEKQQVAEPAKPVVSQTAALSPMLRQASSSPYIGNDFYSFAYSPSDLAVAPMHHAAAPAQASGAHVYGTPSVFDTAYGVSPYADTYASTKKIGAAYAQKEVVSAKEASQQQQQPSSKGYQSRVFVYPSPVMPMASPAGAPVQSPQQQQVVAYPVPVGSQIVGSQAGVDGAFNPYGVHAFTRYAVKPTVVSQDQSYYYSQQIPSSYNKPQQVYTVPQSVGSQSYYPLSFYGYPLNQLHYSQGSIVPSSMQQEQPYHSQPQAEPIISGDKMAESEDKPMKQQKRA